MKASLRLRLDQLSDRFEELTALLSDPDVINDNKRYRALSRERSDLQDMVQVWASYCQAEKDLDTAELMRMDLELREMADEEAAAARASIERLESELNLLMIPKDPNDRNAAFLEVRAGTGGDEAAIFAGDLFRMYSRYAELMGWKIEIMEASEAEAGGYTLISFFVKGNEPFKHLKFESGSHRVQRVPKTETQGRIHTSTATVLVMPDIEEEEIDINPADLVIETHRSSGAGGQHVNKTDSAVRITHTPTGISVNCQDGRSQHDNRATAMRLIRARVFEVMQERAEAEKGAVRRDKIGTGDRSEKIRTYNYPQNRVTDHRIGLTLQQLDRIVEGKLGDVVEALLIEEQRQKLAGNYS